ncbi:unnamed protein product [Brachionus calyciflorus]|uniref:Uncharacterized protein n=1 Tax=Brachionus calyciflorus TaxID=104777 RepID=A0A813XP32_9BILA|nr:unnamed protein product [Brachionus calyciflorus]
MFHNPVEIRIDNDGRTNNASGSIPSSYTELSSTNNSLFFQLQRAREESTNPADYAKKVCGVLCGSILFTIFFVILSAIPITMIIIGAIYKDQCTIDHKIPIWLIVYGVFGLLNVILRTIRNCYSILKIASNELYESYKIKMQILLSIIELFMFVWFICGNVWIYSVKSKVVTENQLDPFYCHATCYYFAFWMITIKWILLGILCCCYCCIILIGACLIIFDSD